MIGNDVEEDLVAGEVGIDTFLVDDLLIHRNDGPIRCLWRGSMAECAEVLWDYAEGEEQIDGDTQGIEDQTQCAAVSGTKN